MLQVPRPKNPQAGYFSTLGEAHLTMSAILSGYWCSAVMNQGTLCPDKSKDTLPACLKFSKETGLGFGTVQLSYYVSEIDVRQQCTVQEISCNLCADTENFRGERCGNIVVEMQMETKLDRSPDG